jgi:hypothetical protein
MPYDICIPALGCEEIPVGRFLLLCQLCHNNTSILVGWHAVKKYQLASSIKLPDLVSAGICIPCRHLYSLSASVFPVGICIPCRQAGCEEMPDGQFCEAACFCDSHATMTTAFH